PAGSPPDCAPRMTSAAEATGWLQAEQANLSAAAELAAATGHIQHATLIPAAMAEFFHIQGRWRDGVALHQTAVAAAREAGDPASPARALMLMIHLQIQIGDLRVARASLDQAMKLYRQLDDLVGEADALDTTGLVASLMAEYPKALVSARKALTIFREIG